MNNFTPRAQQVLALSRKEADRFNHNYVGTEHLLLGLVRLGQGVAVNVLQKFGVDLETLRIAVEKQVGAGPDTKISGNIPYTPRVKKVLALAGKEAKALNHSYVGTEHILLGILRENEGASAEVLKALGVDMERTREEILKELDPNFNAEPSGPTDLEVNRIQEEQSRRSEVEKQKVLLSGGTRTGVPHPVLQRYLAPDETLLWDGIPLRKYRFERRHLPILFFLIPFLAFLILIPLAAVINPHPTDQAKTTTAPEQSTASHQDESAPKHEDTPAGRILGFLFVASMLIGIGGAVITSMVVYLPGMSASTKSTFYGITNQRLIIVTGTKRKTIRSFLVTSLSDIRMEEWPDGLGTISFGMRLGWPYSTTLTEKNPTLENIADPRKVFQIIAGIRKPS